VKISFAIGNGTSRNGVNLQELREVGPLYASDYIYKETHVDNLVTTRKRIAAAIVHSNYHTKSNFYTTADNVRYLDYAQGVNELPAAAQSFESDLAAVVTACEYKASMVVCVGYDIEQTFAPVNYKLAIPGLDHPAAADSRASEFEKIFQMYPNVTFAFINSRSWAPPADWEIYDNWTVDDFDVLSQFVADNKLT
jgi:hypothetical protein